MISDIKASRFQITFKKISVELLLLLLSSFLFFLTFPNPVSKWGFAPLAFFSLIPIFIVIHNSNWKLIALYGAVYGFVTYGIFNYWLSTFHPLAIIIVPTIYAAYFAFFFPVLKLTNKLFPRYGYLVQALCWIVYEYLRTQGFLGYPYGILGYSLFTIKPFIQIASVTGIWGVSLLVILPSSYIGNAIKNGMKGFKDFYIQHRIDSYIYGLLIVANLVFGFSAMTNYDSSPVWKVALIQHNSDSWKGGLRTFQKNFRILRDLSLDAVEEDPDIVIWSETAFVPGIDWHTKYRTNRDKYILVKKLRDFLSTQEIPYLLGSGHGQIKNSAYPPLLDDGSYNRDDYNSALLFEKNVLKDTYRKVHLVPFTENFPFKKIVPRIYQFLVESDFHFWEEGSEFIVFETGGIKFSTPICFEDVFGYISREFVSNGAEIIVNLTNDSWSGSLAAQMQHLGMAVFRSIENRRSLVRSANSGMTCVIDPDGRIVSILEPFVADYLIADVPIYTERTTIYTVYGDWFAHLIILITIFVYILGIIKMKRNMKLTDPSDVDERVQTTVLK